MGQYCWENIVDRGVKTPHFKNVKNTNLGHTAQL